MRALELKSHTMAVPEGNGYWDGRTCDQGQVLPIGM